MKREQIPLPAEQPRLPSERVVVSLLLPAHARHALVLAALIDPDTPIACSPARSRALDAAIEHVRLSNPRFFK